VPSENYLEFTLTAGFAGSVSVGIGFVRLELGRFGVSPDLQLGESSKRFREFRLQIRLCTFSRKKSIILICILS
jgi:hypothetical protein